jgi:hypothetical protein
VGIWEGTLESVGLNHLVDKVIRRRVGVVQAIDSSGRLVIE